MLYEMEIYKVMLQQIEKMFIKYASAFVEFIFDNQHLFQTALSNYAAFQHFFGLHPNFRKHQIFLFGESYGSVYVSLLGKLILDGASVFPVNLQVIFVVE